MNRKQKAIIVFNTVLSLFLLVLVVNIKPWWASAFLTFIIAGYLVWYFYMMYHMKHADKKKKEKISKQFSANHYYYDKWYTPADSTRMENEVNKLKKKKRILRK